MSLSHFYYILLRFPYSNHFFISSFYVRACVRASVPLCVYLRIQQIKFLTAEAGLFLRNLNFFSKIENRLISQQLVDLLRDIAVNIDTLIENANVIDTPSDQRDVIDLIFGFDEHEYCFRRFLECRSCGVSSKPMIFCPFFALSYSHRVTMKTEWVLCSVFVQCENLVNHRNAQELIALSTEEYDAHIQKHQLTVTNASDSFFLPEISVETDYTNKEAAHDVNVFADFLFRSLDTHWMNFSLNLFSISFEAGHCCRS